MVAGRIRVRGGVLVSDAPAGFKRVVWCSVCHDEVEAHVMNIGRMCSVCRSGRITTLVVPVDYKEQAERGTWRVNR